MVLTDDTEKSFRYLTPPLRILPRDLEGTPLSRAKAVHILADPNTLQANAEALCLGVVQSADIQPRLLVWEPSPLCCTYQNRRDHLQGCVHVDVFSPNHLELLRLCEVGLIPSDSFDRSKIEKHAAAFLDAVIAGGSSIATVLVRAGEHGCLVVSRPRTCRWYPPWHSIDSKDIVDVTGAGNTFLGAFVYCLQNSHDLHQAAVHGIVAASFAVEQIGLPKLSYMEGVELWNGTTFRQRLQEYEVMLEHVDVHGSTGEHERQMYRAGRGG